MSFVAGVIVGAVGVALLALGLALVVGRVIAARDQQVPVDADAEWLDPWPTPDPIEDLPPTTAEQAAGVVRDDLAARRKDRP